MEENKNPQNKEDIQDSLKKEVSMFLTQIQEKKAQYENKKQKQSVFARFTQPANLPNPPVSASNQPKKGVPILGILGGVTALFLIFIVLMVTVVAMGGENSALLVTFGVDEAQLKTVLLQIVNYSFGIVAFVLLLIFVISVFRLTLLKKDDKIRRKSILKHLFVALTALFFMLFIWFGTWKIVNGMRLGIPISQLQIQTKPAELVDLVAPVEIEFDTSEIIDGLVARGSIPETLSWDFDADEEYEVLSEEKTISHRFEQEGDVKVGLRVNLKDGQMQQFYKLVTIAKAEFEALPAQGVAPLKVKFSALNLEREEVPTKSFEWDFDGDGEYDEKQTTAQIEHSFDKIGKYVVKLRITDVNNTPRYYSKEIQVSQDVENILKAKIQASPGLSGVAPLKVNFNALESTPLDEITEFEWNFGDGVAKQYGRTVSYTYKNPGSYDVVLTVYGKDNVTDNDNVSVEVKQATSVPLAKIATNPSLAGEILEGTVPFDVEFDAGQSEDLDKNIVEYAWDFDGDGTFDEFGQKIKHTFDQEGEFKIILKVTDSDEQSNETILTVKTKIKDLQAILLADPVSGSVPLKVNFDASTSVYKKGDIVTYEWNFGDGGNAEYGEAKRTHIYDKEGQYTVKLKVVADDGATAETTKTIFARALQLQTCFTFSPKTGSAPLTVDFDSSCSQGEISKWKWDFGDGFISTSYAPTHTFKQKGSYTISLELIDTKNNSSTFQNTVMVE